MGAAASLVGETATEFENFKKIREEYEAKVASGATDTELYDHINSFMQSLCTTQLSLDLLKTSNEHNNCSEDIIKRAHLNLLATEGSKVSEVVTKLSASLQSTAESKGWGVVPVLDAPCAVVTSADNFDSLHVPAGHYSRLPSDIYYCDRNIVLRTQLTAHLSSMVKTGALTYIMSGVTFRIIEEDSAASEMQHKLEYVRIFDTPATVDEAAEEEYVSVAENVVKSVLSDDAKIRWEESDEAFHVVGDAFNDLQTKAGEAILDVARCGKLTDEFTASLGLAGKSGFIVTFDLDHLAMVMNSVEDIRQLHG